MIVSSIFFSAGNVFSLERRKLERVRIDDHLSIRDDYDANNNSERERIAVLTPTTAASRKHLLFVLKEISKNENQFSIFHFH